MFHRDLSNRICSAANQYPIISLTGPRQSGKTTLVRDIFSGYDYVSLEDPDERAYALEDPRGFLGRFSSNNVILDEVQRTPELFSYIQTIVDGEDRAGQFILTGSQNFLLLEQISQSLAGRCAIFHLFPLSYSELKQRQGIMIAQIGKMIENDQSEDNLYDMMFRGFFPRIHHQNLEPQEWLRNYYRTYIERDVRQILNIGDIETFGRFMKLCAGRNSQLLNLTSLATDAGITHTTAKRWLSILEAGFLVMLLRPHHRNFNKRLIKSPKLYFLDTGLLCYLLGIRQPKELFTHSARGAIFEGFVIMEFYKKYMNQAQDPSMYFWRDSTGHEVDLLIEKHSSLVPVEIKSGETISSDCFRGLNYWRELATNKPSGPAALVYAGSQSYVRNNIAVYSWSCL
jgi:uncharacterized protein